MNCAIQNRFWSPSFVVPSAFLSVSSSLSPSFGAHSTKYDPGNSSICLFLYLNSCSLICFFVACAANSLLLPSPLRSVVRERLAALARGGAGRRALVAPLPIVMGLNKLEQELDEVEERGRDDGSRGGEEEEEEEEEEKEEEKE